jgi:DNA-binding CsgD family transcriptional regulator
MTPDESTEMPTSARLAGTVLVYGMRAAADLVERTGARENASALATVMRRADALHARAADLPTDPFGCSDMVASAQWERADWMAEAARCRRAPTAAAWQVAAAGWQHAGRPYREAYALWRQCEALLETGQRPAAPDRLQRAWRLADGHLPLRDAITNLARLGRIPLPSRPDSVDTSHVQESERAPYGLTARELDVLRLLTEGLTNAQIGTRLYMSPKTASVHISAILRKLGAANRVHAAAIAQQAGLTNAHD